VTAGDVYRALWRHKLFIAALTALLVGATWYVTSRQDKAYETSTLVRVQASGPRAGDAAAALQASQTLAQTYAKLISSGALESEIRTLLARCSQVTASAAQRRARAAAVRMCQSLGDSNRARAVPRSVSGVELSASPEQDLDLLSITARSGNPTSSMVVANATPLALRTFIRRTGSRSERIVIAKEASPGSPVSRQLPLNIAIALMVGLIFNGALALLIELFRDRLPERDELERAVGHPVLAAIPSLRLHPLRVLEAPSENPESVLTVEQSLDGEGSSRATSPRTGPEA
jgi:capsular polysaccharide biosynthesis protein